MSHSYFKQVPNFEYVSRLPDAKISDYITVKNLFKRGKIADDIFQDLTFFTKYQIEGDDRPDNVAFKVYNDSTLDWVVLLSNNIVNIQSEWPLLQNDFDRYLLDKYGTYEKLNEAHHYETTEIKNEDGAVITPAGLTVASDYSVTYYDPATGQEVTKQNTTTEVTNLAYEEKKEDAKRNIFLLQPEYLNVIKDDMKNIMPYKKGSTEYISETLKRAENIRLYS
tara:strand:+ start:121 stop:789 length:669 start_codon:yes stop_codon:yes gene_type:complete